MLISFRYYRWFNELNICFQLYTSKQRFICDFCLKRLRCCVLTAWWQQISLLRLLSCGAAAALFPRVYWILWILCRIDTVILAVLWSRGKKAIHCSVTRNQVLKQLIGFIMCVFLQSPHATFCSFSLKLHFVSPIKHACERWLNKPVLQLEATFWVEGVK